MNPQGIYTLVSYGKSLEHQMEGVSNNLANVDTAGYKEDQPAFHSIFAKSYGVPSESEEEVFAHHEHLAPYTGVGTLFGFGVDMGKNFTGGPMQKTDLPLDFALDGPNGFFAVQTPNGERYTRAGNFHKAPDGKLVNAQGYPVLGLRGEIQLGTTPPEVNRQGEIFSNNQTIDKLKVVQFRNPDRLQKMGHSFFAPVTPENSPEIKEGAEVIQGMVEGSNVEVYKEMIRMIQANQAYTSVRQALVAANEMNAQAISLGEV